jgi:tRNA (cytidine/uridine-2'-O-)-methyltransferase
MTPFSVVLVEPEIPQNTGTIGRLCLATKSPLHLVHPLGFEMSHARLKRAGLDYWQHVDCNEHPHWRDFLLPLLEQKPCVFFTKYAQKHIYEHSFEEGSFLIFGRETKGLPPELVTMLREKFPHLLVKIPMFDDRVRSLNLANAVSIALYEAIRQKHFAR